MTDILLDDHVTTEDYSQVTMKMWIIQQPAKMNFQLMTTRNVLFYNFPFFPQNMVLSVSPPTTFIKMYSNDYVTEAEVNSSGDYDEEPTSNMTGLDPLFWKGKLQMLG